MGLFNRLNTTLPLVLLIIFLLVILYYRPILVLFFGLLAVWLYCVPKASFFVCVVCQVLLFLY